MKRREFLILAGLSILVSQRAFSQQAGDSSDPGSLNRWNQLSEEQKAKVLERWETLNKLTPEERKARFTKWKQYRSYSPEKRAMITQNLKTWKKMDPVARKKMMENFSKFKNLPAEKQEQIRKNLQDRSRKRPSASIEAGGEGTESNQKASIHPANSPVRKHMRRVR